MNKRILFVCFLISLHFSLFAQKDDKNAVLFMHHINDIFDTSEVTLMRTYNYRKVIYGDKAEEYLKKQLLYTLKDALDSNKISTKEKEDLLKDYKVLLQPFNWDALVMIEHNISITDSIGAPNNIKLIFKYLSKPITTRDGQVWLTLEGTNWANMTTWSSINIYRLSGKKMKPIYRETFSVADNWLDSIEW